ncbi:MAG: PEP-CTERM sorting domain-containing protein [Methylomonas sp.]|nr:PEP-CTERM sorting domain-containing protein [Methylomonas sp.]PPD19365.1 MAG: hypothetical protein CTY23_11985 [Methylomonas sp.]PPD38145.1 MAG: hypothetical protein CTY17_09855 [Methylomonas sp.]PPD51439.1 MAG: hypothetical protein CTY11_12070 [Methylomonas sp.]
MANTKARRLNSSKLKLTLAAASLVLASTSANATVVTLSGSTVNFSFNSAFLLPIFGTYSVSGDTLSFSPINFIASQQATGFDWASGTTPLITITAKSGYWLTSVSNFEQGGYQRLEQSPNSTVVGVSGLFSVNNTPVSIAPDAPLTTAISAAALFSNPSLFQTTPWTSSQSVGLAPFQTSATAKVENLLLAGSMGAPFDKAFIEKKLISVSGFTTPVPVPSAIWLFGSALTGIVIARRKKTA